MKEEYKNEEKNTFTLSQLESESKRGGLKDSSLDNDPGILEVLSCIQTTSSSEGEFCVFKSNMCLKYG